MKVLLTVIGYSGSNHSAFFLCRATNMGLNSTLYYVHAQISKGVVYCSVKSVPCTTWKEGCGIHNCFCYYWYIATTSLGIFSIWSVVSIAPTASIIATCENWTINQLIAVSQSCFPSLHSVKHSIPCIFTNKVNDTILLHEA